MKVLIGFASMSGNTEEIMLILKEILEEKKCHVEVMEMDRIAVSSLTTYDLLLLGSYTWGDGDLPYEIEDFYDEYGNIRYL